MTPPSTQRPKSETGVIRDLKLFISNYSLNPVISVISIHKARVSTLTYPCCQCLCSGSLNLAIGRPGSETLVSLLLGSPSHPASYSQSVHYDKTSDLKIHGSPYPKEWSLNPKTWKRLIYDLAPAFPASTPTTSSSVSRTSRHITYFLFCKSATVSHHTLACFSPI